MFHHIVLPVGSGILTGSGQEDKTDGTARGRYTPLIAKLCFAGGLQVLAPGFTGDLVEDG